MADEDDGTSELDQQWAAFLHRFDAGINSVLEGKLSHLPNLDPLKARVRAGLLFAASYVKHYLHMLQPEFANEILQYEARKKKEEQASALAKIIKKMRAKTGEATSDLQTAKAQRDKRFSRYERQQVELQALQRAYGKGGRSAKHSPRICFVPPLCS